MDPKKQLVIRSGSVRRLGADYRSYLSELSAYQQQLTLATQNPQADPHNIKKQQEFVDECQATLHDIRLRLTTAIQQLTEFMNINTELIGTTEWEKAQKILNDNRAIQTTTDNNTAQTQTIPTTTEQQPEEQKIIVEPSAPSSATTTVPSRFVVSVYGGAMTTGDSADYKNGVELGRALAESEFHILTGGYTGMMEAVSRGASTVAGSIIEGVLSPSAFPAQGMGNVYLTRTTLTNDLPQRIITFLQRAQAFVVMPGGLGTLTELCLTWNVSAVATLPSAYSADNAQDRRLVLLVWRQPWQGIIDSFAQTLPITPAALQCVEYVDSVQEIISKLTAARQRFTQVVNEK